jgi:hypothetical protein
MTLSSDLERRAHRSGEEYAWRRGDAKQAARELAASGKAILGGELWLVRNGEIWGLLPQKEGPPAVYHWETERQDSEPWADYVHRSCADALAAIAVLPAAGEVEVPNGADIYYNLTWVSEHG